MAYDSILLDHQDRVAVLTLNRPERLNAISPDMVSEMQQAVAEVANSDARALVLTGAGRGFCAGADLAGRGDSTDGENESSGGAGSVLETHYHPLLNRLRELPIPMVSAINGAAVGVGMSFAVMADLVVAAKSAYFLQAFARIGLIPDGGATWFLPRMIGWSRAVELSMLAERLPAEQALEWGLINRITEDDALMDTALELAGRLAAGPYSIGLIRKAYWESPVNSFEEQLQLEARLQMEAGSSADFREGVSAFLQKRDAKFEGR